jgi:hypothetical protein
MSHTVVLTSHPDFYKSLNDSITSTFGLPIESGEYYVQNHSWGDVVVVLIGEYAGTYDIYRENGFYKFITA